MTLIKWKEDGNKAAEKRSLLPSVFSDVFDSFFGNELFGGGEMVNWIPAVNIAETDERFKIDVAAPGLSKNDFKVEVDNGVLSISGERKEEKKEDDARYTRREFSYGSFKRTFNLPDSVEGEKISASFENGVLSLTIPKKEEAKRKPAKEIKIS